MRQSEILADNSSYIQNNCFWYSDLRKTNVRMAHLQIVQTAKYIVEYAGKLKIMD